MLIRIFFFLSFMTIIKFLRENKSTVHKITAKIETFIDKKGRDVIRHKQARNFLYIYGKLILKKIYCHFMEIFARLTLNLDKCDL